MVHRTAMEAVASCDRMSAGIMRTFAEACMAETTKHRLRAAITIDVTGSAKGPLGRA